MMVDAIAARMRRYPKSAVDQRWQSQLTALGAEVWWEHDDHYVTTWGDRQGLDRATVITTLVDVLHLLATLPPSSVSVRIWTPPNCCSRRCSCRRPGR